MHLLILLLLSSIACIQGLTVHAPYQVGLYQYDNFNPHFGVHNYPMCSAAIIHPLFCVTTASCVHAYVSSANIARPIPAAWLYIKSGNFSETSSNVKYVKSIYVHPEFNTTSWANDIAVIQLESSFPLDHLDQERWVQLPSSAVRNGECSSSTNTPNVTELYPFTQQKSTEVVNNVVCQGNKSIEQDVNNTTLCSFYQFDHSFMCKVPENQLRFNRDRGTPLICNHTLSGLLSIVFSPNTTNLAEECSTNLNTNALYTDVALYTKWIHSLLATNAPTHNADGEPIPIIPIPPPYQNIQHGTSSSGIPTSSVMLAVVALVTWLLFISVWIYT